MVMNRKLFSEIKKSCKTKSQRLAFNRLVKSFAKSVEEFNDYTLEIATEWDLLYNKLQCAKSTYSKGGDTCYMYIVGSGKDGKSKIKARVLDFDKIILFNPSNTRKGYNYYGNVFDLFKEYSHVYYLMPYLNTEPSLYKKVSNVYLDKIIKHYIGEHNNFSDVILNMTSQNTEKIIKTINAIANNPRSVTKEVIEVNRVNFPKAYEFFDDFLNKSGFLEATNEEEFKKILNETHDLIKTFDGYQGLTKSGWYACTIPDLEFGDWILTWSSTGSISFTSATYPNYVDSISVSYYFNEYHYYGDFPNATTRATIKIENIPYK